MIFSLLVNMLPNFLWKNQDVFSSNKQNILMSAIHGITSKISSVNILPLFCSSNTRNVVFFYLHTLSDFFIQWLDFCISSTDFTTTY